ncbi:MAG: bifunctional phosphopantothenoylcysteine decarboxylase/phosphopantothenate--cysteine ligase CoaBC [Actinomycetota bacterium]|nr:bifunctional phosphopantothenoylcysteine decarboxylase/phosphopantothenate--cysteine ligase CoaBC [Actinomycetota bacterium]
MGPGPGALYAPEICRRFAEAGHRVEVVLGQRTSHFVGPAAFAGHATVVREPTGTPQALVFAPATAGTIARLARGMSEGPVEEAYATGTRPAVVAPDLDSDTARHPAVLGNLDLLRRDDGCRLVGAEESGMASAGEVASAVFGELGGPLEGMRIVITTGGTREPIDSVRFVGNRSSGKMGLAIAREALGMGAEVSVVAANVEAREPGVAWTSVETVDELREAVVGLAGECNALVMAAAVSDFKPATALKEKIRRGEGLNVEFVATEDILKSVREQNPDLFMVGFAATHGDPVPDAREKLGAKGVNLVVGNDISREGIGFGADENEVYIVGPEGERFVARTSKREVARAILGDLKTEFKKERRR